jgi:hypothetical protein
MSAEHGYKLVRLVLNGDRVVAEEKLLADRKGRIRYCARHRMDRST